MKIVGYGTVKVHFIILKRVEEMQGQNKAQANAERRAGTVSPPALMIER